jgi:NTE family protein
MIEMSEDLQNVLTYEDKLDRSPENINRLIEEGEKQGQRFLEARFNHGSGKR